MEKYLDIFRSFKKFVSKKDITDAIKLAFDEEVSDYTYKKIVEHYVDRGIISEVSEKRKKFFITTDVVMQKNISAEDYFYAEKLGIKSSKSISKSTKVNYDNYLQDDAVIVNNEVLSKVI